MPAGPRSRQRPRSSRRLPGPRSRTPLLSLRVIEQRPAEGGELVQVVRDASGALLRFAVGADGEPRVVALLAPPPR